MDNTKSVRCSFPTLSALGILFVALKLCGVINWSWWWILIPFYGPLVAALVILAVFFSTVGIATLVKKNSEQK